MADENDRGGSDLDIFEGLGKKNSEKIPVAPPAPPSASNRATVRANVADHKLTLLGIPGPAHHGPGTSDAPPGRGSLPSLGPPKSDPPPARGVLDDDDDAAETAVFEKDKVKAAAQAATTMEGSAATQNIGGSDNRIYVADLSPEENASLSDAFASLGEPEAKSGRLAPPPSPQSASMRAVPLPPPPPPRGAPGMATLPSAQQSVPPPPSIPPVGNTVRHVSPSAPPPPMPVPPPAPSPPVVSQTGPSMPPPAAPSSLYPPSLPPVARHDATYTFGKKDPASNNGFIVAVLAAIVAVAGACVFFFMPRTGNLVINVADVKGAPVPNLSIAIDGTKKCDSAPCILKDIQAGTHSIAVSAPGYDPVAARAIAVESRKDVTSDFSLAPSKAVPSNGTGVKIGGPAGVKLTVDNKDVGVLPVELKDLETGDHRLHFAGDRYASLDKTITVGKDEMVDMGNIPLKVTKGKATIQLTTVGAKVTLVNGTTRKEVPQFPMAIEFDPTEKWTLSATKDGFDPYSQAISFDDGQAEKTYTIELAPKGGAATGPKVPKAAKIMGAALGDDDDSAPARPAKTADTSAASGDTALKLNSLPSASVYVDGVEVGHTPIPHFTVKPGSHTIMFVNAEQSLKKTISVDVKSGETKAAFAKLRDE